MKNPFAKPLNLDDIKIAIVRAINRADLRNSILKKQLQHIFTGRDSDKCSILLPRINSSLMAIIGNAEIAQMKLDNLNPEELKRHIHSIIEKSRIIIDEINRHTMDSDPHEYNKTTD